MIAQFATSEQWSSVSSAYTLIGIGIIALLGFRMPLAAITSPALVIGLIIAFFGIQSQVDFLVLSTKEYVADGFNIPNGSMAPALVAGDHVLVSKLAPISRWSIIAFYSPNDHRTIYCKRIAALPGETIEIRDGYVLINGRRIPQPVGVNYIGQGPLLWHGGTDNPVELGPDEFFVLGDNSQVSLDSRYFAAAPGHQGGAVPADYIIGCANYLYWPPSHAKPLDNPNLTTPPKPLK